MELLDADDDVQCVGCGRMSPQTETNYTLISAQHGWRLTKASDRNGQVLMEWRCPICWAVFRKKQAP